MLSILFFGFANNTQCQQNDFTLKVDKDTININAGEAATYSISFAVENGFDASIFLSVDTDAFPMQSLGVGLSSNVVNTPYKAVILTITTTANFTKVGSYEINITGKNGLLSSSVKCHINVLGIPNSNWRIMPMVNDYEGIPRFIIQDASGNYWHDYKNLHRESNKTPLEEWGNTSSPFGSVPTTIPPVIDNKSSKIWLPNSQEGLTRYSLEAQYKTIYDSPFLDKNITAIAIDSTNNAIWVGTTKGLARLTGSEWTFFDSTNTDSMLTKESITSIIISDSVVWIGTIKGLVKFNGTNWVRFTPQNSLIPAALVRILAADRVGNLWMGLSNETYVNQKHQEPRSMIGLVKFDGTNWTLYNNQNSPLHKDNYVNAIAIDKKGNKWIATASHRIGDETYALGGAGILKFDDKEWTAYTKENTPLPDNRINWLGLDNNDNIWFHHILEHGNSIVVAFWGVFNPNGLVGIPVAPTAVHERLTPFEDLMISPNPVSNTFTISKMDGIFAIKIVNTLGMEFVSQQVLSHKSEFDVSELANGVYFLQLHTATGMISKPIIINH